MFISEIFSSSGQPASVTPNTLFLKLAVLLLQALASSESLPWLWHQMQ